MDRRYAPVLIQFHHHSASGILSGRAMRCSPWLRLSSPGLLHGVVIDVAKDVAVDKKELLVQLILEALDPPAVPQSVQNDSGC